MQRVVDTIRQYCSGKAVAVAVSGGIDSMCLLSLFADCRDAMSRLVVMTVDHGIRAESGSDAEFVATECARRGIECSVYRADIPRLAKESGQSIELAARQYRLSKYRELLGNGIDMVALAHHADDQIETVLYRILRGSGVRGLVGMSVLSDDGLLRPMLAVSKADICAYVRDKGLEYRQDVTNFDTSYDRNFLRLDIIPKLKERWNLLQSIPRLSSNASSAMDIVGQSMQYDRIEIARGKAYIPISLLSSLELIVGYLYYASDALGLDIAVSSDKARLIDNIITKQSGKRAELQAGISATVVYDRLCIGVDRDSDNAQVCIPYRGLGEYSIDYCTVSIISSNDTEYNKGSAYRADTGGVYIGSITRTLCLDVDAIPSNSVLRTRAIGDVFCPYGSKSRSLKRYLIDKKIDSTIRDKLIVVASGSRVLCVCGVEISDDIKITDKTINKAKITISYNNTM